MIKSKLSREKKPENDKTCKCYSEFDSFPILTDVSHETRKAINEGELLKLYNEM